MSEPVCPVSPSSVGDAMCTISAASCFPEPFVSEGKRLGNVHRNFAGSRFSDHVAMLSVFQAWDEVRSACPTADDGGVVVVVCRRHC